MPQTATLAILVSGLFSLLALASPTVGTSQATTPSAMPSVTPYPDTSHIEVRFVLNGEPVEVFLLAPIDELLADGEPCGIRIPAIANFYQGYTTAWPATLGGAAQACFKGPPTLVEFRFRTPTRVFSTTDSWNGEDVTLDLEVPPELVTTATPSSSPGSPTATPHALPSAGGSPGGVGGTTRVLQAALIASVAGIGALGILAAKRRR
jgi:hypothetical protein